MGVGQGTGSGEGLALVNAAKSETWGLNLATEGPSSKRSPTPYKESDMAEWCSELVTDSSGWHRHRCRRPSKVERDGARFCTQHDPERVAAREKERQETWEAKWVAERAALARAGVIE